MCFYTALLVHCCPGDCPEMALVPDDPPSSSMIAGKDTLQSFKKEAYKPCSITYNRHCSNSNKGGLKDFGPVSLHTSAQAFVHTYASSL